jgi:hypothetical protein
MGGRAGHKGTLSLHCPVEFDGRYFRFFGYRVRQNGDIPAMEKIENPIMKVSQTSDNCQP